MKILAFLTGGSGGGTEITVVANYTALVNLPPVTGEFYWCEASQGTWWIPGPTLGTYYPKGLYYCANSTGPVLEYMDVPYQATQTEVDAGTVTDKFVSPKTFNDSAQLAAKVPTIRELTINGTTQDLTADRSWTVTGTSPLTTKGDLYTFSTLDARLPVGLDTQVLLADSSTTTGLKWGTNTAATPLGYYGAWQDDITQTAAASNTGYPMKFRIADIPPNGISIVSDTQITFANTGIYNIQFSSQFQNTGNAQHDVTIWLRLNGSDVAGSSGFISVPARRAAGAGNEGHIIVGWNYVLSVVAGQYYELVWSTTNHTDVTMEFYAAGSPPPSAASVIMTVTQQSGIMAGTGITAINSLTGAAQTLATNGSGIDFNISSVGTTHTFNLPTASATNRGALSTSDWSTFNGKANKATSTTGVSVAFATPQIYNSRSSAATGNITGDYTNAIIGVVQKIYHNDSVAPTFPGTWVKLGSGTYTTSTLNVIYVEWVSGTIAEYWIVKGV